jgi:hypothetical protein
MAEERKNFFMVQNIVVNSGTWASLSPSARSVYFVLARFAHPDSGLAYPGIKTISILSGFLKDSVCKATTELQERGLITKKQGSKRFHFKMTYRILREPDLCIIPSRSDKSRKKRVIPSRSDKGRFETAKKAEPSPSQSESCTVPSQSESCTVPSGSEKKNTYKDIKKTYSRDDPSTPKKEISKVTLRELIKAKGFPWLKSYIEENDYPTHLLNELYEESKVPEVDQESKGELEEGKG